MTTFVYSSGDPSHLAAGGNASMADMQGPLIDLRTFLNGNISDVNLSSSAAITETKLATGSNGLAKGSFSVYDSTATSIANAVATKVSFETEEWDISGWFDNATNFRFTPQVPGIYRFSAALMWAVNMGTGTTERLELYKNGAAYKKLANSVPGTSSNQELMGTVLAQANGTTDFFEIFATQNTGAAVLTSNAATDTYFQGELVGRS